MKAVVFHGRNSIRIDTVPDPIIKDPKDVIIKISSTAICGSDLHLYDGFIPTVEHGDIFGHEFMGEVVEIGSDITRLQIGDRIIVPFIITCGICEFCTRGFWSLCDNTNPNKEMAEKVYGYSPAGFYGYSHMFGGYCGGQAEYARVPFAETSVFKVPKDLPDEKLLFLTDIFPTGYMAAENADIPPGGVVAVWGAGPVGQFAIRSAFMLGASRVIAIDRFPERLEMARAGGAETIDYEDDAKVSEALKELTNGKGPDSSIDAVGMEAHGAGALGGLMDAYDKAKQAVMLESDRPTALRQVLYCAKKGSTVSIPGVYGGLVDKFPIGMAFNKGLTLKMGQTHVQQYVPLLLEKIVTGEFDPSFVVTHRLSLDEAPHGYEIFKKKEDRCVKVVLTP
ncbi:MAG TPA: zinc-dependent alcohol dehydrogenase [Candidatus Paceibacterota bacterium]|nr:zinc-dependent alcohol dehydrogenase [Candidatus Paceibacterota bacterium]